MSRVELQPPDIVETGVSKRVPLHENGMLLKVYETDTVAPYRVYVDGQNVIVDRPKRPEVKPITYPLRRSINFSFHVEQTGAIRLARFEVMVSEEDGSHFLEVRNNGALNIEMYEPKTTPRARQKAPEREQMSQLAKSTLSRCWPFLTKEQIEIFSRELKIERYRRGEIILQEGDSAEHPNDKMFFVVKGKFDVIQGDIYQSSITPQSPAPYFGERALITKEPRNAKVMVSDDNEDEEIILLSFSGESLKRLKQLSLRTNKQLDLIIRIRDGLRVTPFDLANTIDLPPEIHSAFSHWLDYLTRFMREESGSSGFFIQAAKDAGRSTLASENLVIACGYLVKESLEQGKFPEVTLKVKSLIEQAIQYCEHAGNSHYAQTLKAMKPNMESIATVLAAEYLAHK